MDKNLDLELEEFLLKNLSACEIECFTIKVSKNDVRKRE